MLPFNEIKSIEKISGAPMGSRAENQRLLLVQEGILQAFCEGNFYLLSKGDFLLIPPFAFLSAFAKSEPASCILAELSAKEELAPCAYPLPEALAEGIFAYCEEPEGAPLFALAILQRSRAPLREPLAPRDSAALFMKAAAILEERVLDAPSVDALAEELSLSLSKLKRLFARYAGIGVHEYLMELRIALGKQALMRGCSVTESAELCGFSNQAYFSAAFKKSTGFAPKEYPAKDQPAIKPAKPKKKTIPKPTKKREMPNYLL